MDTTRDHLKVKELHGHRARVKEVKRQAHRWRLTDCSLETLDQMRHALIEEMETLEAEITKANRRFLLYVQGGHPFGTEEALQEIDRLTVGWEQLDDHLQDLDEAILERHLQTRLVQTFGSMRRLNWFNGLVFASIVFIVLLTLIELMLDLPTTAVVWIMRIDTVISLFLLFDFGLRLKLAEDKGWFFRRYWIDLLAAIPFHQVLALGPLVPAARFARLLRLVRLGRVIRTLLFTFRGLDKLFQTLQMNLLKKSLLIALALLIFGALSIGNLESGAAVAELSEGMWWSFATVVTGGFADLYNPSTLPGRVVTVGLVLLGLTVTGIFTASLTSVLVEGESDRIEQAQHSLAAQVAVIDQKLELLSGETNEGLIALETVSQALSNQTTRGDVARTLTTALIEDFNCIQASVHLLGTSATQGDELIRIAQMGRADLAPPSRVAPDDGLIGRVAAALLATDDVAETDLEPETEPQVTVDGVAMVCPLVAGRRFLGLVHLVMPEDLGRFYLYNRAPMTLTHHAALAFHAVALQKGRDES